MNEQTNSTVITPETKTVFPIKTVISLAIALIIFGGWVTLKTNAVEKNSKDIVAVKEQVKRLQEVVVEGAATRREMLVMLRYMSEDIKEIKTGDISFEEQSTTMSMRKRNKETIQNGK